MSAGAVVSHEIEVAQGATVDEDFRWNLGGAPVDLTGYTARMMARVYDADPDPPVLSITSTNNALTGWIEVQPLDSQSTPQPQLGLVVLHLYAALTASLAPGAYVYDLFLDLGSSHIRFLRGNLTVLPSATR